MFDDGRLTDALGQIADFRHTIIILTSNLGATAHQSAGLGFAPRADSVLAGAGAARGSQSFRPEFVNRLDKVIVFRPLTRDRMRSILRKELARVLERRGLREPRVGGGVGILGARIPARKGILARAWVRGRSSAPSISTCWRRSRRRMVERRFPTGDQFLFVRSDGAGHPGRVRRSGCRPAKSCRRPLSPKPVTPQPGALASAILQPAGTRAEREQLQAQRCASSRTIAGDDWEHLRDSTDRADVGAGFLGARRTGSGCWRATR